MSEIDLNTKMLLSKYKYCELSDVLFDDCEIELKDATDLYKFHASNTENNIKHVFILINFYITVNLAILGSIGFVAKHLSESSSSIERYFTFFVYPALIGLMINILFGVYMFFYLLHQLRKFQLLEICENRLNIIKFFIAERKMIKLSAIGQSITCLIVWLFFVSIYCYLIIRRAYFLEMINSI